MARPTRSQRPQPKPELEIQIERIDADGYAVAQHERKLVRVSGALPGERVRIAIEHEGRYQVAARLRRILTRSPDRVSSPCRHTGSCDNCSLIGMAYPAQLRFKQQLVVNALAAYPALATASVAPTLAAPHPFGYRTQVKLAFGRHRRELQIGVYRRGSHAIVDLTDCPLHHPLINRIIAVVREEVARQQISIYDEKTGRGLLRYLLVRVAPSSGQAMVTFVTTQRDFRDLPRLAKWLTRKLPEVVSVQQNVNSRTGNVILGRETLKLLGHPTLFDQVGETRLAISPASFFQVNHDQAAAIYRLVREWADLKPQETALDLYCGIGGIALGLARTAAHVIGIEVVEDAVHNARENARLNRLDNCRFIAGDVVDLLEDLESELPPGSVAVLNPPRKGCDPEVLEALPALELRALLYVSCDPQSLARDLDILSRQGWQLAAVQPVDMFPQTVHVETVVKLVPARS